MLKCTFPKFVSISSFLMHIRFSYVLIPTIYLLACAYSLALSSYFLNFYLPISITLSFLTTPCALPLYHSAHAPIIPHTWDHNSTFLHMHSLLFSTWLFLTQAHVIHTPPCAYLPFLVSYASSWISLGKVCLLSYILDG